MVTITGDDPELLNTIRGRVELQDAVRERKRSKESFLARAIDISDTKTTLTAHCKDFTGVMDFLVVLNSEFLIEREVHQVCGTIGGNK